MKKWPSVFLFVMVAFFFASSSSADLLLPSNPDDFLNPDSIVSGDPFEEAWLEGLVGEDLFLLGKEEAPQGENLELYNLNEPANILYYILKFGNDPSHWAFMDGGAGNPADGIVNYWDFGGQELSFPTTGLSHVSYYGTAPVPEPSTILLLGLGLVGLAGIGRKKMKS